MDQAKARELMSLYPWYDRWLYKLGFVRAKNYRNIYSCYEDVFGWWTKEVNAKNPELKEALEEMPRLYAADLQRVFDKLDKEIDGDENHHDIGGEG